MEAPHLSGQSVPVLNHSHSKEVPPTTYLHTLIRSTLSLLLSRLHNSSSRYPLIRFINTFFLSELTKTLDSTETKLIAQKLKLKGTSRDHMLHPSIESRALSTVIQNPVKQNLENFQ